MVQLVCYIAMALVAIALGMIRKTEPAKLPYEE